MSCIALPHSAQQSSRWPLSFSSASVTVHSALKIAEQSDPVSLQMEGMVNDLHVGREKQQQFDEWKQGQPDQLSIDLSVTVLTTGFWPSYKVCCQQKHLHRDSACTGGLQRGSCLLSGRAICPA